MLNFLKNKDKVLRKSLQTQLRNLWTHSSTAIEGIKAMNHVFDGNILLSQTEDGQEAQQMLLLLANTLESQSLVNNEARRC